jgi:hypothetical protein
VRICRSQPHKRISLWRIQAGSIGFGQSEPNIVREVISQRLDLFLRARMLDFAPQAQQYFRHSSPHQECISLRRNIASWSEYGISEWPTTGEAISRCVGVFLRGQRAAWVGTRVLLVLYTQRTLLDLTTAFLPGETGCARSIAVSLSGIQQEKPILNV